MALSTVTIDVVPLTNGTASLTCGTGTVLAHDYPN